MTKKRLNILIGNDDGINAIGIKTLARVLGESADVYVVAPMYQKSGYSHGITCASPLYVHETELPGAKRAWYVEDGTPADAMKLGLEELCKDAKPDLVIAGINNGPNLGTDVFYSGTVAAAFEGFILGIPSIAVSINSFERDYYKDNCYNYELVAEFVKRFISWWQANDFRPHTFFNINTPERFDSIEKAAFTTVGRRIYDNVFESDQDDKGSCYRIYGEPRDDESDPKSDLHLIKQGYITIAPLMSNLTDYQVFDQLERLSLAEILD